MVFAIGMCSLTGILQIPEPGSSRLADVDDFHRKLRRRRYRLIRLSASIEELLIVAYLSECEQDPS
jgi:hypothetical protein